jgi:transcriptional regulator with XRE-family HTH domain
MAKKRNSSSGLDGINSYIGQRLKLRRDMLGMTQKQLAEACDVTFQQIQKYETGETQISAGRLYQLGMVLDMPVSFLFSGLPNQTPAKASISISHSKEYSANSPKDDDPLAKNESLELVKLYWNLPNDAMRENIMALLKSMKQ